MWGQRCVESLRTNERELQILSSESDEIMKSLFIVRLKVKCFPEID